MSLLNRPLLGFVAFFGISSIIGSGFCLWVFNENGETPYASINGVTVDCSYDAKIGHFETNFEDSTKSNILMVFTEGNSSADLNEGIEFYKEKTHEVLNVKEYVKDDSITIVFHKDKSFDDLKLQLGVNVNLVTKNSTDSSVTPLDKFIKVNDAEYENGNFVDLTKYFQITQKDFPHKSYVDDNGNVIEEGELFDEYTYTMHVNNLFSYASMDVKPTTYEKYKALYEAFAASNANWEVEITFMARYIEGE